MRAARNATMAHDVIHPIRTAFDTMHLFLEINEPCTAYSILDSARCTDFPSSEC